MDIADTVRAIVVYTAVEHGRRVVEDCLKHHKIEFSYLRDENGNVWAIMFGTSILDLETHEISEIH